MHFETCMFFGRPVNEYVNYMSILYPIMAFYNPICCTFFILPQ